MNDRQALAGIRVLDVGGTVATGYCGKLFADHGADVIDVEPPHGAATRRLTPFIPNAAPPDNSALHAYLSANKRSVVLDTSTAEGRRLFLELARDAHVVLDASIGDGRLSLADLESVAPGVVLSRITWFGQTGPYADYAGTDGVCHALIGMLRGIGPPQGPPVMPAGYQAQIVGGLTAYIGTLGQVIAGELGNRTESCLLDTSILEANLCFTEVGAVGAFNTGAVAPRMGVNRLPPTFPLGIYPCRDGWLGVTALTPSQWASFCALLDLHELANVPVYQTTLGRLADAAKLEPIIMQRVAGQSAQDLFERGQAMRVPLALVPTMEQLFSVDQYVARGAFAPIVHPTHGPITVPTVPFKLHRTPASTGGAAPRLGAHSRECFSALGATAARFDTSPGANVVVAGMNMRKAPLHGVRVIDLSMGWAGPLAARHLADMGAQVIKIESCERFDWWRGWEATEEWIAMNAAEQSNAFNTVNRNKLDVTLDLMSPDGKDLLKRLVAIADIVVENYSAGVLPKLGLGYDALKAVNPQLVMLSMPAFGSSGPWAGYRAYGSTVEHASGLPHLSGEAQWPPTMVHVAYGDAVGGLNGAAALLTALRHRRRTGEGQFVDLSQAEGLFPLGIHGILTQSVTGRAPERMGNRSTDHAPHGVYPALGDDQWVVIQILTDPQWRALTGEIVDLEQFGDLADRLGRRAEIDRMIVAWTQTRRASDIMERLQLLGIPAAAVQDMIEVLCDPHLSAREFWQMLERAYVGTQPNPVAPYRVGRTPTPIESPAPTLGQHNAAVLTELVGLNETDIARLSRAGVIGDRPVMPRGSIKN